MARVDWSRWFAIHQFLFHIFFLEIHVQRNEVSSWTHTGDDCHKKSPFCGLKRRYLTLAFQSLYFRVFVLYNSDAGFVAIVKSCRIMLNGVHCRFVDLKSWATHSVVKPLALERTSGVLTEISWWSRRKFFNHFLPAFTLSCKTGF